VDEQRRIADLLWAADNAVTEWNDTLGKLDTLYEAFLEDSLLTAQSDGSLFDVNEICKEVTVGIVVNPSKYYADSGIVAISHSNIFRGEIDITNVSYFTPASHKSLKKTWLYSGDVVLPRVSTIAGRPYYAAVVPDELNEINAIGIIILRPDSSKVNPYYLEAYLNAQSIRRRLVGIAVGSIQRQLNVGIIAKEKVFIPSFEKQNEIATKSITFKKNIRQMKEHLDKQVSLKNNLLRHVLTGK
jgi:type I restriction enzyme S subunit